MIDGQTTLAEIENDVTTQETNISSLRLVLNYGLEKIKGRFSAHDHKSRREQRRNMRIVPPLEEEDDGDSDGDSEDDGRWDTEEEDKPDAEDDLQPRNA